MRDGVGKGQPPLEKTMLQPLLEMVEGLNAAPEEGLEVKIMNISQIVRMKEKSRFGGLPALLALMEGRKSYFWLQS